MLKVHLHPRPKSVERLQNGVDLVVYKMHEHLTRMKDVTLVDNKNDADVYATHICPPKDEPVDVLHCHGLYPTATQTTQAWMYELNQRVIDAARTAYVVTVPSEGVAELFRRDMGFNPWVIPHGLDLNEWPDAPRDKPNNIVLWNKNREIDVCDPKPVNDLADISPDFRFLSTFGNAAKNVSLTGVVSHDKMKEMLYRAGIYYAPTPETFGIGILEALAAGLPVLAWEWGNAPHLITHGVNGYLVQPHDSKAAREGLLYIMEHYVEISHAARARALDFSWEKSAEMYVECYKEAIRIREAEQAAKITVVIPCYNYEQYVGKAIESVKEQTYKNWECIVVDDGSTDNSVEVIRQSINNDPKFKVITQKNSGVAAARNHGAIEGTGAFLMFLDADDYLLPHAMQTLLPDIVADRNLGVVYGKLRMCNAEGVVSPNVSAWPEAFDSEKQIQKHNQVPSCNLLRMEAFLRTGGFRQRTAPCEDGELWTTLCLRGYVGKQVTQDPVYVYRLHNKSASTSVRVAGKEPDWTYWLPGCTGGLMPFASRAKPEHLSHPVYPYDQPWVSFVIPVGPNHRDLLADAIDSVAAQKDARWECIVVDDTEEDVSAHGIIPYKQRFPWVRWLKAEKPHNVSASRNQGAKAARGKYLIFLDADDYLLPDFLTATLKVAVNCKDDTALVYTDWIASPDMVNHVAENWHLPRLLDHALFAVTFLHPKSMWQEVKGFDENMALWEDWDYTVRLGLDGFKGIRAPSAQFVYRYDTGVRREESLKNKGAIIAQLKEKYVAYQPKPRRG